MSSGAQHDQAYSHMRYLADAQLVYGTKLLSVMVNGCCVSREAGTEASAWVRSAGAGVQRLKHIQ